METDRQGKAMHASQLQETVPSGLVGEAPRRSRWFYLWYLPLLWGVPVAAVWLIVAAAPHDGNSNGILIALAALPMVWLIESWNQPFTGELAAAVTVCSSGMVVMSMLGLLQDLLGVPRPRRNVAVGLLAVPLVGLLIPPFVLTVAWPNLVILFGLSSTIVYACVRIAERMRG